MVDARDHDGGGVATLPFLLSVMVRRCDDVLVDEHSVLENTLLCETLTSTLRVSKSKREMRQFLFLSD